MDECKRTRVHLQIYFCFNQYSFSRKQTYQFFDMYNLNLKSANLFRVVYAFASMID